MMIRNFLVGILFMGMALALTAVMPANAQISQLDNQQQMMKGFATECGTIFNPQHCDRLLKLGVRAIPLFMESLSTLLTVGIEEANRSFGILLDQMEKEFFYQPKISKKKGFQI